MLGDANQLRLSALRQEMLLEIGDAGHFRERQQYIAALAVNDEPILDRKRLRGSLEVPGNRAQNVRAERCSRH